MQTDSFCSVVGASVITKKRKKRKKERKKQIDIYLDQASRLVY